MRLRKLRVEIMHVKLGGGFQNFSEGVRNDFRRVKDSIAFVRQQIHYRFVKIYMFNVFFLGVRPSTDLCEAPLDPPQLNIVVLIQNSHNYFV